MFLWIEKDWAFSFFLSSLPECPLGISFLSETKGMASPILVCRFKMAGVIYPASFPSKEKEDQDLTKHMQKYIWVGGGVKVDK